MKTANDNIASWVEERLPQDSNSGGDIATETQPVESPAWRECIDSLLRIWRSAQTATDDSIPNRRSIEAAITWINILRQHFPGLPPTCVTAEPAGGIIVERRVQTSNGDDYLCELTFYNDGNAEQTDYVNGRVLQMREFPPQPQ